MKNRELDRLDRLILNSIQLDFPVVSRPYDALAQRLNEEHQLELSGQEVYERVLALKHDGFIRRLGAVFNARALGYSSTLCAAKVPEGKLDVFSRIVNNAPEVTHNYLRNNELNAWFTFTTNRPEYLTEFLERLKRESGVDEVYVLESEKLFKIKVNFQFSETEK